MTSPEGKGVLLGAVNAFVIALATIVHFDGPADAMMIAIVVKMALILSIPGVMIGAFAGVLAGRVVRFRVATLVAVPCLGMAFVVFGLLAAFLHNRDDLASAVNEVGPILVLAFIPTAAAALVLERWTRPAPVPCAPGAIARARR